MASSDEDLPPLISPNDSPRPLSRVPRIYSYEDLIQREQAGQHLSGPITSAELDRHHHMPAEVDSRTPLEQMARSDATGARFGLASYMSNFFQQTPRENYKFSELKESYETFIQQLYGLPVKLPSTLVVNNVQIAVISFEQAKSMLRANKIERILLDPMLQPWAGLPSSPNRIMTLFAKDGRTYAVKVKYDLPHNAIFPPV